MSQDNHVLHLRSNLANNYPTHDKTLSGTPIMDYGEIAINYAAENEFISIKNSNNILTVFRTWPYIEKVILDNELVTAAALTALKESCGFNKDGMYVPSSTSTYISESTTVTEALEVLDKNLAQTYTKDEIDAKGFLTQVPDEIYKLSFIPNSSGLLTEEEFNKIISAEMLIIPLTDTMSIPMTWEMRTEERYLLRGSIIDTGQLSKAYEISFMKTEIGTTFEYTYTFSNSSRQIPIRVSQLTNDSDFITTTNVNSLIQAHDNAINYQSGYNTVTTLSNIPQTKRSVLCSVSTDQTFYLNMNSTLMPDGQEIHVLVRNTNTTNNIIVAYSTNATYVRMSGDSLTIQPSSWGEINVLRLGNTYYIRGL